MRHAFSMLEMVMTLVIIGIMAAVAVPRVVSGQVATRLEAVESRLEAEFLAAGELAHARGMNMTVQIHVGTEQFRVYEGQGAGIGALVKTVDFSDPPYEAELVSTNIPDASGYIGVSGYGMFDHAAKVQVRAGSRTSTVNLSGPTKGTPPVVDAGGGGGGLGGILGGLLDSLGL